MEISRDGVVAETEESGVESESGVLKLKKFNMETCDGIRTHQQAADGDVAERPRDLRVQKLKIGGEGGWVRWWMVHVQDKSRNRFNLN